MQFPNSRSLLSMALGSVLGVSMAHAAPVSLPQTINTGFGSTSWSITNTGGTSTGSPYTGTCNDAPGLVINDATSAGADSDAYDNAFQLWVGGSVFVAPDPVDLTGTTLTAGPVAMSGLNVTVQYWFDTASAVMRMLISLQNPSGAPISTTVQVPVNFGSDGSTILHSTSSGDAVLTTADRWAITSQGGTGEYNTVVSFGSGAVTTPPSAVTTTVFDCASTEGAGADFNVTVPAGTTRTLMFFAGLGGVTSTTDSLANAQAAAPLFDTLSSVISHGWANGMTSDQLAQLVNWTDVPEVAVTPSSIPTMSEWGLTLSAIVLAGFGAVSLRRRRS